MTIQVYKWASGTLSAPRRFLIFAGVATLTGCTALPEGALFDQLSQTDIALADQAVQDALERAPSGDAVEWSNTVSGITGSVTPLRTFRSANGAFCRDYQETLTVAGASERYVDTACRDDDGQWRQSS